MVSITLTMTESGSQRRSNPGKEKVKEQDIEKKPVDKMNQKGEEEEKEKAKVVSIASKRGGVRKGLQRRCRVVSTVFPRQ